MLEEGYRLSDTQGAMYHLVIGSNWRRDMLSLCRILHTRRVTFGLGYILSHDQTLTACQRYNCQEALMSSRLPDRRVHNITGCHVAD